jgi:DNA-binding XRE family transcriptional regulator
MTSTQKRYPELHDADWLRERYVRRRWGTQTIAAELGCAHQSVRAALRRHGIPIRSHAEATRGYLGVSGENTQRRFPELSDADWLRERYVERRLGSSAIADELGCAPHSVRMALRRHRIPIRSRGGRGGGRRGTKYPELRDADWLRDRYLEQGLLVTAIAAELGCSRTLVQNALVHHGIPRRGAGRPGLPSPNVQVSPDTIGGQLREARMKAGLTQEALVEASGVSSRQLVRIELGDAPANVDTLLALLKPLGLTIAIVPAGETSPEISPERGSSVSTGRN